jgi:hypothetical protein
MAVIASTLRISDSKRCWLSEQDKGGHDANRTQKRMNHGHGEQEDGRPRQVEEGRAGGTAEELAQGAKVAPCLRCSSRVGPQRRLHGSGEHGSLQALFEPSSDAGEHFAPQGLDDRMERERKDDDEGQHEERVEALARQHVIVDLQ